MDGRGVAVASGVLGSFVIDDGEVTGRCNRGSHGYVTMPARGPGVGIFPGSPVRRIAYEDGSCTVTPWAYAPAFRSVMAVGFDRKNMLLAGSMPNGSNQVAIFDERGRERARFGGARATADDGDLVRRGRERGGARGANAEGLARARGGGVDLVDGVRGGGGRVTHGARGVGDGVGDAGEGGPVAGGVGDEGGRGAVAVEGDRVHRGRAEHRAAPEGLAQRPPALERADALEGALVPDAEGHRGEVREARQGGGRVHAPLRRRHQELPFVVGPPAVSDPGGERRAGGARRRSAPW